MCGRFSQAYSWDEIVAFSQPLTVPADRPNLRARYNIAPTTEIDMIVLTEAGRELRKARWGLIPSWFKGTSPKEFKFATFNARIEDFDTKASFKSAYKSRRCIIPASGFFEWTGEKGDKIPHYFTAADGGLFGIAGLWERWRSPEGEEIVSCTMVVREANVWTAKYHDRMPCMLLPENFDAWLDGSGGKDILMAPRREMQEWIVSQRVNKTGAGDDDPTTIEPFQETLF